MIEFILGNVLMLAAGLALYLLARALPRVAETEGAAREGILDRWVASEIPERLDAVINGVLEKFLRKAKVSVLKVDNALNDSLKKVRPDEKKNGAAKIDFKDVAKEKEGNSGK